MNQHITFLLIILFLNVELVAEESFQLTSEDYQLINTATHDYDNCVQQNAAQQLDNYADVRQIAAHAVNLCEHHLTELEEKIIARAGSDFLSGMTRHIKNRSIKKLLPILMYEKSARQEEAREQ
ncbi:MAG: hypothetical protein ACI9SC_000453 [Gammaproteobacteria bacterium]|jgi:hypothetical protein